MYGMTNETFNQERLQFAKQWFNWEPSALTHIDGAAIRQPSAKARDIFLSSESFKLHRLPRRSGITTQLVIDALTFAALRPDSERLYVSQMLVANTRVQAEGLVKHLMKYADMLPRTKSKIETVSLHTRGNSDMIRLQGKDWDSSITIGYCGKGWQGSTFDRILLDDIRCLTPHLLQDLTVCLSPTNGDLAILLGYSQND